MSARDEETNKSFERTFGGPAMRKNSHKRCRLYTMHRTPSGTILKPKGHKGPTYLVISPVEASLNMAFGARNARGVRS